MISLNNITFVFLQSKIMKKIFSESRFKKYSHNKAKRSLKKRKKANRRKNRENKSVLGISKVKRSEKTQKKAFWDYEKISSPTVFSLLDNPEEVIAFINKIEMAFNKRKKVYVLLDEIEKINNGAIIVLLSTMFQFRANKISFNGTFPKNKEAREKLEKSGFLSTLYGNVKNEEIYNIGNEGESIFTHAQKKVDAVLSDRLIQLASQSVWGENRRCIGVQRVFLELMQNTNNHAVLGKEGEKHWWVSITKDDKEKKVAFSFMDYGVGVFKSLENKDITSKFFGWFEKLKSAVGFETNAQVLKLILEGVLHRTVTKSYFRGKGLPGIFDALKNNHISNLHIITNDVFADVSNDTYYLLKNKINGTFVYWEINTNNKNLVWKI